MKNSTQAENEKLQVGTLTMILLILGPSGMKVDKSNLKKDTKGG
tara:strand:+ start:335 stop:466 length:132 start_codon:yes stop_codon:yes gene_type:complete